MILSEYYSLDLPYDSKFTALAQYDLAQSSGFLQPEWIFKNLLPYIDQLRFAFCTTNVFGCISCSVMAKFEIKLDYAYVHLCGFLILHWVK